MASEEELDGLFPVTALERFDAPEPPPSILAVLLPAHMKSYYRPPAADMRDPLRRFHSQMGSKVLFGGATLGRNAVGISFAVADVALLTAIMAPAVAAASPAAGSAVAGTAAPAAGTGALATETAQAARLLSAVGERILRGKDVIKFLTQLAGTTRGQGLIRAAYTLVSAIIAREGARMAPKALALFQTLQQTLGKFVKP